MGKQTVGKLFCLLAAASIAGDITVVLGQFRAQVTTVLLEAVVVRSDGTLVKGLKREQFEVVEDGRRQPLLYFSEADDLPISLGVLVDEGAAMKDTSLAEIRGFLFQFMHQLKHQDELCLAAYDDDVRLLSPLTSDRVVLNRSLDEIYPKHHGSSFKGGRWNFSGTANTGYAVDQMIRQLRNARHRRKVILVFSAAFNNTGEATQEHLQQADIFFYSMAFKNTTAKVLSLGGDLMAKGRILEKTAGLNFEYIRDPNFSSHVSKAIQYQYSLGYPLTGDKDLSKRKIEVRVPGTDFHVRFKRKLVQQ
jgi:VWFA-related protein